MAGLFSSNEQDVLGTIMQQRDKSNQALGSGYGKYGGIVQAGAGMADIGGDAMFGGATGASDPRMIEQQEVKAIFSQAATQTGNSTSPEFFTAFSELLAAKFPEQSQKAMEQAQKVQAQTDAKEDRVAKQAAATKTEATRVEGSQMLATKLGVTPEQARLLIDTDPKAAVALMNPELKTETVTTKDSVLLINSQTGAVVANLGAPPKTGTSITNVLPAQAKAQTAYGGVVGAAQGNRDVNLVTSAEAAKTSLPKILETEKLLNEGNLNTGLGASIADVFSKAQAQFLNDKKAGKKVSDSEYLDSLLGSAVFDQLSALGIGARGLDTPAEREFLLEVVTGKRTLNRDSLKRITQFRKASALRAIENYNDALSSGALKEYQETLGRTFNRMETPQLPNNANIPPPTSNQSLPIFASNGNERIVSRDGGQTWQPVSK